MFRNESALHVLVALLVKSWIAEQHVFLKLTFVFRYVMFVVEAELTFKLGMR